MSLLEAVVMGVIQGLTEFLPISSTAHLFAIPQLLGWGDRGAGFTAVIQLGTLIAVLWYFRADIVQLAKGFWGDISSFRYGTSQEARLSWMIIVGTVPIVICGVAFKDWIKKDLRNLYVVTWAAIGFACLLAIAEWVAWRRSQQGQQGREDGSIGWRDAIIVGMFQALALIPGASRSGVTITAGLFAGLSRSTAARFSFLLSLPSIFAAGMKELYDDRTLLLGNAGDILALVVATIVSGVVGYASIAFLLGFLRKYTTFVFIGYRLLLGTLLLVLLASGVLKA